MISSGWSQTRKTQREMTSKLNSTGEGRLCIPGRAAAEAEDGAMVVWEVA